MSPLRWTCKSTRNLAGELGRRGYYADAMRWEREKEAQHARQIAQRNAYIRAISPQLNEIQALLEKAVAREAAATDALNKLTGEYRAAAQALDAERRSNVRSGQGQQAADTYADAVQRLVDHYKPQITALQVARDEASNESL